MDGSAISANIKNFSTDFPDWLWMIFWAIVYCLGLHPDAPWGDGLGYAIAVHEGFDLSSNANSHFAYLNFYSIILKITGIRNSLSLLSYGSVFWACISLLLVSKISRLLSGSRLAGIISLQILASGFAFWRLACIPEVYTMELAFFCAFLFCLVKWLHTSGSRWFFLLTLLHALGILVHIHLILLFPTMLLCIFIGRRSFPARAFLLYLIPILTFLISVEVLKLNSWSSILFENQQDQLFSIQWSRFLKGPFFTTFLLLAFMPGIAFCLFLKNGDFKFDFRYLKYPGMVLFSSFFFFASLYPDPGIFVFLLPAYAIMAIAFSACVESMHLKRFLVPAIPVFQTGCYLLTFFVLPAFAPESFMEAQKLKGGHGFVTLPWARGNVASVIEKTHELNPDSIPMGMLWNSSQVFIWDSIRLADQKAIGK